MIPIITGAIGLMIAALIIVLMRRDRLHVKHGLGWVLVAVSFALLGFSPGLTDQLARYLGVAYPPVLALTLGIAVLVIKILLMDIERSHTETQTQRMIQRIAMLETDIKALEQEIRENKRNK